MTLPQAVFITLAFSYFAFMAAVAQDSERALRLAEPDADPRPGYVSVASFYFMAMFALVLLVHGAAVYLESL